MGNSFGCRNSRALAASIVITTRSMITRGEGTRFGAASVPASRCWSCRACTFDNDARRSRCEMCGTHRDTLPRTNPAVAVAPPSVVPSPSSPPMTPPVPLSAALENALASIECPVCLEAFDDGAHAPCTLPGCGHSFCLAHGSLITRCPICRKYIDSTTRRGLVKSITLLHTVRAIALLKDASLDAAGAVEENSLECPPQMSASDDRSNTSSGCDVAKERMCPCQRARRMCCQNSRAFSVDERGPSRVGVRHHGDRSHQQRRTSPRPHAGASGRRQKVTGRLHKRRHHANASNRNACSSKEDSVRCRRSHDVMPAEGSPMKYGRSSSVSGSSSGSVGGSGDGSSHEDGKHSRGGGGSARDQGDDVHIDGHQGSRGIIREIAGDDTPIDEPSAEIRPCGHRCELSPSPGSCCNCVEMDRRLIGFLSNGRYVRCKDWLEDSAGYDVYCHTCRDRCKGEAPHTDSFLYSREIEG